MSVSRVGLFSESNLAEYRSLLTPSWDLHKSQLKSDRTSCRSANANQVRLILHTAAYWLMWALREAAPARSPLRTAEFATIRLRLLKVAARVIETASRIRVALASACPDASIFRSIALTLRAAGP